jgi:hypothetical protein
MRHRDPAARSIESVAPELVLAFPELGRGSRPREHDVFVLGVLGENLPVSRYSMISPPIIEESMSTRIGESVRLMI